MQGCDDGTDRSEMVYEKIASMGYTAVKVRGTECNVYLLCAKMLSKLLNFQALFVLDVCMMSMYAFCMAHLASGK